MTVSPVAVATTATTAVDVAVCDPSSAVTANVYVPARSKVTVVSAAAAVPSAENAGDAPAGADVAAQVYVTGDPSVAATDR